MESSRRLLAVADAVTWAAAATRDQVQGIAFLAQLVAQPMQRVGIVIGVGSQIALDRRLAHQTSGHDTLVLVHGSQTPGRDTALRIDDGVDFVAFGLAAGGSAVACLPILGATTDDQRLAVDDPVQAGMLGGKSLVIGGCSKDRQAGY